MEEKKRNLYRSRSDAILGGVCGGLGAYLGVDANIVRLVFLLLLLASGTGLILYLALWLLLPQEGATEVSSTEQRIEDGAQEIADKARDIGDRVRHADRAGDAWVAPAIGIALVVIGAIVLLHNLGIPALWWMRWRVIWPAVLIVIGLALLLQRGRRG